MGTAYEMLCEMRNKKLDEGDKLFEEFSAIINAQGSTESEIYQAGLKWAGARAASEALSEAIGVLLKAGVI